MGFFDQIVEIGASELPFEWLGDGVEVLLEAKEAIFDLVQGREVVGSKDLTLKDGKIDFDLVEPTCVNGAMNGHDIWECCLETLDGGLAAMGRTVVDDPKYAAGITVGGLVHDLSDEAIERIDAGGLLTTAEDLCSVNVEGSQVGPGASARIFVFDPGGRTRTWRQGRVFSDAGLNAGFLVSADNEFIGFQGFVLPLPSIQIENAAGFGSEVWIAREDPATVLPGADRVFVEPAPHCLVTDGSHDTRVLYLAYDVSGAHA